MKRKSLRALAITIAAVQMLMLVSTAKVSASTESLAEDEEFMGEEIIDEEVVDEEPADEEIEDEEPADEEIEDEEAINEEIKDKEPVDEEPVEEPAEEEESEVEDNDEITYLLKVIDQYLDEEGTEEKSDIRYEYSIPEGEGYSFSALNVEGYELVSDAELSGVVTEDTTLIFTYSKVAESNEIIEIQTYAEEPVITLYVYTSEEALDNNEAPYMTLNSTDDGVVKNEYSYSFTEPDIPIPEGFQLDYWSYKEKYSDGGTSEGGFNWQSVDFNKETAPNTYYVYPVFMEIKDTYTVTFYLSMTDMLLNENVYATTEAANGGSVSFPDIPSKDGYIFAGWHFEVRGSYIGSTVVDSDYKVTRDINVYADFIEDNREFTQTFRRNLSFIKAVSIPFKDNVIYIDNIGYLKLSGLDDATIASVTPDGHTFIGYYYASEGATLYHCDISTNSVTKIDEQSEKFSNFDDVYLRIGTSYAAFIYTSFRKDQCLVTINDAYYEEDGTTLIKTDERSAETVAGGTDYSYSALNPSDYTLMGYSIGTESQVREGNTAQGTVDDDLVITFKYKKSDSTPTPKPDPKPDPDPKPTPDTKPEPKSVVQSEEPVTVAVKESVEIAHFVEEPKTGDVGGFNMQLLLAFAAFDSLLVVAYLLWGRKFVD